MRKESILECLNSAKKEYGLWVARAETMMEGASSAQEQMPLEHIECSFGVWLKGEGQKVGRMPGMDTFRKIEESHEQIHDLYSRIFLVYGSKEKHPVLHKIPKLEKNPLLYKLLTRKKRSTSSEKKVAIEYYGELKDTSKTFIELIERFERRISALPASSFSGIG